MRKNNSKRSRWLPPKGAYKFFSISADYEFSEKHPIGYALLLLLGLIALFLPLGIFIYFLPVFYFLNNWLLLGWAGCFVVGIGLFNIVSVIIKQYLGHLVTLMSFLIGGIMILISLVNLGVLQIQTPLLNLITF